MRRVSSEEVLNFYRLLAGVLHLGNIEFVGEEEVSLGNKDCVDMVCKHLAVSENNLVTSLTYSLTPS